MGFRDKNSVSEKSEAIELTRNYKYVITFVIYFCYFFYAMNFYITGPSLLDLEKSYKTSFYGISIINTVRSLAFTFGAFNGFVLQSMDRQLVFMLFLLIIAITTALIPLLPSMNYLLLNFALNGFASGGIESLGDVWILEMWHQECGPFEQALHFSYALGSVVTSILVKPFLSEDKLLEDNAFLNSTDLSFGKKSEEVIDSHSLLYIPYSCLAIAIGFIAIIFGFLYLYKKYIPPQTPEPEIVIKQYDTLFDRTYGSFKARIMPTKPILLLIVLSSCLISMSYILEWSQFNYFPSFAHFSNLHISEKKAADMTTCLAIAFTTGRGIAIPLSHFLKPKQMICGNLSLLLIANLLFLFFANHSETIMSLSNIIYGLGLSSFDASVYAMLEEQTHVNNFIGTLFIFMSGLTGILYPIFLGYYIESEPLILVFFGLSINLISFLILFTIRILIKKYQYNPHVIYSKE